MRKEELLRKNEMPNLLPKEKQSASHSHIKALSCLLFSSCVGRDVVNSLSFQIIKVKTQVGKQTMCCSGSAGFFGDILLNLISIYSQIFFDNLRSQE